MKRRIMAAATAMMLCASLTACFSGGTTEEYPTTTDNGSNNTVSVDDSANTTNDVTDAKELTEEDKLKAELQGRIAMILPYYEIYLSTGYDAENNKFVSPETEAVLYSPSFAIMDINADSIPDVIVTGDFGIRDKKMSEVYYFSSDEGAFYAVTLDGTVEGISNGFVIASDDDRDDTFFYTVTRISELAADTSYETVTHKIVENWDGDVVDETIITGEGEEMSYDDYEQAVEDFEFEDVNYEQMTAENISKKLSEFGM